MDEAEGKVVVLGIDGDFDLPAGAGGGCFLSGCFLVVVVVVVLVLLLVLVVVLVVVVGTGGSCRDTLPLLLFWSPIIAEAFFMSSSVDNVDRSTV